MKLTAEQLLALEPLDGPVQVVAGAGTGKTAVIAERYRRLVERGVNPGQIVVMTFSDRAAAQMRERIGVALPGWDGAGFVGTFHALALGWAREEPAAAGFSPGFRILSGPDRWVSMRQVMWRLAPPSLMALDDPDLEVSKILRLQELMRQELVGLGSLRAWAAGLPPGEDRRRQLALVAVLKAHDAWCQAHGVVSFDDLIVGAIRLLSSPTKVSRRLMSRPRWILVDEYQDTNPAQERLIELLAGSEANLCVVGDDDQSIYRFRGASRANLEAFRSRFERAVSVSLGANLRSRPKLVDAAKRLIENDLRRLPKPLAFGGRGGDGQGRLSAEVWPSGNEEKAAVANWVAGRIRQGVEPSRIAVLARTRAIAAEAARELGDRGIELTNWSARGFYQRPEVKDVIAYLRLVNDPRDFLSAARLVQRPPLNLSLEEAWPKIRLGARAWEGLLAWAPTARWAQVLSGLARQTAMLGVEELMFEVLDRTGYAALAGAGLPASEANQVTANLGRLAEVVERWREHERVQSLARFLDYLDLVLLSGVDEERDRPGEDHLGVQVMSIHQAKGLEFDAVVVPSVVEGRLPQQRRSDPVRLPAELARNTPTTREDHRAEERRLLYVAMTRARRALHLTAARSYDGQKPWVPSTFFGEMGVTPLDRSGHQSTTRPDEVGSVTGSVRLSFTSIRNYLDCPRSFWYRYVLELPVAASPEAKLGTAVHEVLREVGNRRQAGGKVRLREVAEIYEQAWKAAGPAVGQRELAIKSRGLAMLRRWWQAGGARPSPSLVEARFSIELGACTLVGFIDRIDRTPEGWLITDFKTGRGARLGGENAGLQLALYWLGATRGLGLEGEVSLALCHLRTGKTEILKATPSRVEAARKTATWVAGRVDAGRFEARPVEPLCRRCAYRAVCPEAM